MKQRYKICLTVLIALFALTSCTTQEIVEGPYFGQEPPGMTAEVFAPGIVSTEHGEFCSMFSADGKEFIESGVYTYQPQDTSTTVTIRWSKSKDGSLVGEYTDSEGLKIAYTLKITGDKSFKTESTAPDGRTLETVGHIDDDGKVHTKETMRAPDGTLAFSSKNVLSRKATTSE